MAVPMSAMTSLSGKVSQSILDRTDAEKVFCPWWDGLEDIVLKALMGLGKSYIRNTPDQSTPKYFALTSFDNFKKNHTK